MTADKLREMREAFEQSQRELFGFWAGSLQYREHLDRYEDQEEDRRWQTFKASWTLATNRERAKALWAYLKLKRELPQTFAEAKSNVVLAGAGVNLPPSPVYASI